MKNCQGKTKTCANYHFKYLIDLSIEDIMLLYQGEIENE
jgi:hypothetical protein